MFSRYRADCFRTVSLGKAGSFHANELIGEPYGLAYEIVNQKLNKLPPRTIQELGAKRVRGFEPELTFSSELTEATNELINDDKVVQPLTTVEIEALKQSGVHSSVRALASYPGQRLLTSPPYRKSFRNRSNNTQISLLRPNTARRSTRNGKKQSTHHLSPQESCKLMSLNNLGSPRPLRQSNRHCSTSANTGTRKTKIGYATYVPTRYHRCLILRA